MSVQTRIATSVFCAFSVFICGLFTISLALGVYVFYASDIGGGINYEYPINSVIGMYDGEPISAIDGVTIGHIFAIMWALTATMPETTIKISIVPKNWLSCTSFMVAPEIATIEYINAKSI